MSGSTPSTPKPSLAAALRAELGSQAAVGEHPSRLDWLALTLGKVAPAEAATMREHAVKCRRCFEILRDLLEMPEVESEPAATEEAWRELLDRRAGEGPLRGGGGNLSF